MKERLSVLLKQLEEKNTAKIKDIDGIKRTLPVGKYVWLRACEYPDKVFVLQEVKSWRPYIKKHNLKLLRFGYHIIGKKPKKRGKWVWGQYCPFITDKDLKLLIQKAKKKGIL